MADHRHNPSGAVRRGQDFFVARSFGHGSTEMVAPDPQEMQTCHALCT
jgi:hypothetical protein